MGVALAHMRHRVVESPVLQAKNKDYWIPLAQPYGNALNKFVENGGTLIAFASSSDHVIDNFNIPVRNALARVKAEEFSVPGSLVRLNVCAGTIG